MKGYEAIVPLTYALHEALVIGGLGECEVPASENVEDHEEYDVAGDVVMALGRRGLIIAKRRSDAGRPRARYPECPEQDCRKVAGHRGPHFPVPGDGTPDGLRGGRG